MTVLKAKVMSIFLVVVFVLAALPLSMGDSIDTSPDRGRRSRGSIIVNASGGGDYTRIQWAIDNASDGDTVYVEKGTYCERISINISLQLIGEGADKVIIRTNETVDTFSIWSKCGIWLNSTNSNISDFSIMNCHFGIYIISSYGNQINRCNISSTGSGIFIRDSSNCAFLNNTISSNIDAVQIQNSTNLILKNNQFNNCGISFGNYEFLIEPFELSVLRSHEIDASNTIDGKPIYYLDDCTDYITTGNASQIILVNCTNVTVQGQFINSRSGYGIAMFFSNKCSIIGNEVTNCYYGLYAYNSSNNIILDNQFDYNGCGGAFEESHGNMLGGNSFSKNGGLGLGVQLSSENNTLENNQISGNGYWGLYLCASPDVEIPSVISHNNCSFNGYSGMVVNVDLNLYIDIFSDEV